MTASHAGEDRVYYPALDGMRFIAIALVYLFHGGIPQVASGIDALAHRAGWQPTPGRAPAWSRGEAIVDNGWIGVQLFFILSGFLITTLLLREEARTGRIDLRAFWMRRILRIWPLYYLIVGLTFFVLPALEGALARESTRELWKWHLLPFLAFGGNWSMAVLGPVQYAAISVLWSVCVEEQFYLFCPLLIAWVRPSRRVGLIVGLMGLGVAARAVTATAVERRAVSPVFFQYSTLTHLDTLLSGVLLALIRERRGSGRGGLASPWIEAPAILAGFALLCRPALARTTVLDATVGYVAIWGIGAAWVALAASGRGILHRVLSYDRFVWLGRISYGLYMFHELAFWLRERLFAAIGWFPNQEKLAPFASLALTIGLASASYYGFERRFLKLKMRWSRVASRPV